MEALYWCCQSLSQVESIAYIRMPKRSKADLAVDDRGKSEDPNDDEAAGGEGESGTSSDSSSGDSDEYPDVSDAGEDEDEDDDDTKQEEIVIDFEFFPPKEIDFHGLKALLFTYLDGRQYDAAGLVTAILKQVLHATWAMQSHCHACMRLWTELHPPTHISGQCGLRGKDVRGGRPHRCLHRP